MSSIDGTYSPFDDYPGYSGMAPCMRTCDHSFGYNGCDRAPCWCNKGNLDLRVGSITRCASSECTFANMNTATDVSVLSGIQVMYCADRGQSPAGMTMPSTVDAMPTGSSDPFATDTFLVTGTASRTRPTSGPAATAPPSSAPSSNVLSTAAKIGIGIGAGFCVLVAISIVLNLIKRRSRQPQYFQPPPPHFPNGMPQPPPMLPMAPTPYSGSGPFTPPPLQQPAPIHPPQPPVGFASSKGDVSPIEEKAFPVSTVTRKLVKAGALPPTSPGPAAVHPQPQSPSPSQPRSHTPKTPVPHEVPGSVPPLRHEASTDGQITKTVSTRGTELPTEPQPPLNQYPNTGPTRGTELDGQQYAPPNRYPGPPQYEANRLDQWARSLGYQGEHTHEVDGGQNQWREQQRQELPGQPYGHQQQHSGAYELGPGR